MQRFKEGLERWNQTYLERARLSVAVKLSHLCGVLSQSVRKNEPPSADGRSNKLNRVTSCILHSHANKHDNNIQAVFLWFIVERFWNCIWKELVKEQIGRAHV